MGLVLNLPGAVWTELIDEVISEALDNIREHAENLFSDDVFPGTMPLPAKQRLAQYLDPQFTNPQDYPLLFTEGVEQLIREGQAPAPVSPFWLNKLAIPGEFTKAQKDFDKLLENQG